MAEDGIPIFRRPYVSTSLFRTFSARRLGTKSYPCPDKSFAGPAMSSKSSAFLREPISSYPTLHITGDHIVKLPYPETYTSFRNRDIWGEDADVWRPSRWLDGSVKSPGINVGVWSNLYAGEQSSMPVAVFDLVSESPLAPVIVPVSAGNSRESSLICPNWTHV